MESLLICVFQAAQSRRQISHRRLNLICVHKKDAAFYYDSPSQTLFGSAEYPITVNDPFKAYRSTDFSDLNDDGNSDVRMTFEIGGDITVFAWLWDDKNNTFVFSEALSDSGTAEKQ